MPALPTPLRNRLEAAVKLARRKAEAAAKVAVERLTVGSAEPGTHLSVDERQLRNRLRAHGRQLGDGRDPKTGIQSINRLIHECAYEHWHRMLFARFLAENQLLIHDKEGMPVTLAECDELARDEVGQASRLPVPGASSPPGETRQDASPPADRRSTPQLDGWTLAARYAARMLPQIFRPDDPVLQVGFAPEHKRALEKLVTELPVEIFTAEDSLGWVYQFWQAERKDEVNASGDKITGETLPAVTQLFTEHYMVLFLLHNTIGAWWAAKQMSEGRVQKSEWDKCQTEDDCRKLVALPGYEFTYLRFIREEPQDTENSHKNAQNAQEGGKKDFSAPSAPSCGQSTSAFSLQPSAFSWRPAAGSFPGWPKLLKDFKLLDPCCGSGHFLVAAFVLLVLLRMRDENLSAKDACDAVLRENLHGLELDPRCTQIAAFALALTAWKFPNLPAPVGDDVRSLYSSPAANANLSLLTSSPTNPIGYRALPPLNIACSGLGVNARKEDWLALANDDTRLRSGLEQLYDLFQKAPELGSLINPRQLAHGDLLTASFAEIQPLLTMALQSEKAKRNDDLNEIGVAAQGMAKAAICLSVDYHLVITNVPYLARSKQGSELQGFSLRHVPDAKMDLATMFVRRCHDFCSADGSAALVTPQSWLFQPSYRQLRERLLTSTSWNWMARLGTGAFDTVGGAVVNVVLLCLVRCQPTPALKMWWADVSGCGSTAEKASELVRCSLGVSEQLRHLKAPDARVTLAGERKVESLLSDCAEAFQGLRTGDGQRFVLKYWEVVEHEKDWVPIRGSSDFSTPHSGIDSILLWESGTGQLAGYARATRDQLHDMHESGNKAWGKRGIAINQVVLQSSLYEGETFDGNVSVIVPKDEKHLAAIWTYCSSEEYFSEVRRIDQSLKVTNRTLVKVPFDLMRWL